MSRKVKMRIMPWFFIILGFLTLSMFQGYVAITCMVLGIVMMIERKWPEKWESTSDD